MWEGVIDYLKKRKEKYKNWDLLIKGRRYIYVHRYTWAPLMAIIDLNLTQKRTNKIETNQAFTSHVAFTCG